MLILISILVKGIVGWSVWEFWGEGSAADHSVGVIAHCGFVESCGGDHQAG